MKIAVIGCGNMSTPIIKQINKSFQDIEFITYSPGQTKAKALAESVKGKHATTFGDIGNVDIWFLGFKPQQLDDFAKENSSYLEGGKIISILAATPVEKLCSLFKTTDVIRIMPNTPVAYGEGISLLFSNLLESNELFVQTYKWFECCGKVLNCETEKDFDLLTLFSGSGPGYLLAIADSYLEKMISLGFDAEISNSLLAQLFKGVGQLMEHENFSISELKAKVTSKGGVTEAALEVFDKNNIVQTISDSIDCAVDRSNELSQL